MKIVKVIIVIYAKKIVMKHEIAGFLLCLIGEEYLLFWAKYVMYVDAKKKIIIIINTI